MLSNTSKRRAPLIAELPGRGFRSEWLHDAICSGECCWEAQRDSGYASAVVLGWSDRDSSAYLAGTGVALADGSPDVIVAYGPDTIDMADRELTDFRITGDMAPYRDLLEDAVERNVRMLCANPDQRTIDVDGKTPLYMPGTMADAFEACNIHLRLMACEPVIEVNAMESGCCAVVAFLHLRELFVVQQREPAHAVRAHLRVREAKREQLQRVVHHLDVRLHVERRHDAQLARRRRDAHVLLARRRARRVGFRWKWVVARVFTKGGPLAGSVRFQYHGFWI